MHRGGARCPQRAGLSETRESALRTTRSTYGFDAVTSTGVSPLPNWFETRVSFPFTNSRSSIFSLYIGRPYSSFRCPTIFRVFMSMTSLEEQYARMPSRPTVIQYGPADVLIDSTYFGGITVLS